MCFAVGVVSAADRDQQVAQPVQHQWITDYVMVRLAPGAEAVQNRNGKWSFALTNSATAGLSKQAAQALKANAEEAQTTIRRTLRQAGVADVARMGLWAPEQAERAKQFRLDRYYQVMLPPGTSVADAQALADALEAQSTLVERAQLDAYGTTAGVIPDDTNFSLQYGLDNQANPSADIDAPNAWMITTGVPQLILAVLDSGVSPHSELAGRAVAGINTVDESPNTVDGCNHGTHVAGTAAANTNNGAGIAGVNWNVRIMPIRVLTGCNGTEADLSDGLQWAADHGANVANMSLQYTVGSDYLHDGVLYARAAGMALFAATGNFGTSGGIAFPGRWPETITIGASNNSDGHWFGSNSGPEITLSAPGADIWSLSNTNGYFFSSGSSMATAHASGVACLMRSVDPSLTHDEIRTILIDTADDIEDAGFDQLSGYGRIDAAAALQAVLARLGTPGDVNADHQVNSDDRDIIFYLQGVQWGQRDYSSRADMNHDGTIDADDLAYFDELYPPCPGDIVHSLTFLPPGDGNVNGTDLGYLLSEWGNNPDSAADIVTSLTFQPPGDGVVDGADLGYLLSTWGPCPTAGD